MKSQIYGSFDELGWSGNRDRKHAIGREDDSWRRRGDCSSCPSDFVFECSENKSFSKFKKSEKLFKQIKILINLLTTFYEYNSRTDGRKLTQVIRHL